MSLDVNAFYPKSVELGRFLNERAASMTGSQILDLRTGYTTVNVLATPLIRDDGFRFGCLELINAPAGFARWHLEAARAVATYLSRRYKRPA